MKVLSIDPGVTTGWSVVGKEKVYESGTLRLSTSGALGFRFFLRAVVNQHSPDAVVIERGPSHERQSNNLMLRQDGILNEEFPDAQWMTPNEWKPTPRGKSKVPKGTTQHEQDSIRMGREFIHINRRKENHGTS